MASGIAKRPTAGPWTITKTGIVGDHQGDIEHHGGPEKAIHHYPREHYASWRTEHPEAAAFHNPPSFGENISIVGLTEDDVCVGDVYRIGSVVMQISQGRQPCWRINAHTGLADLAQHVRNTGRTGWYYRVLEAGVVQPGSQLRLDERPRPEWTLKRLMQAMFSRDTASDDLSQLANLPELAERWRQTFHNRLLKGSIVKSARFDELP